MPYMMALYSHNLYADPYSLYDEPYHAYLMTHIKPYMIAFITCDTPMLSNGNTLSHQLPDGQVSRRSGAIGKWMSVL